MIRQHFLTSEEKVEYKDRWRASVADKATNHLCLPTFTFVRDDRFIESPWFTGNDNVLELLMKHIKETGGRIESSGFYVPFSNGCEVGMHGKDAMKADLAYVTTQQQFRDTFGISMAELVNGKTDTNLDLDFSDLVRSARRT